MAMLAPRSPDKGTDRLTICPGIKKAPRILADKGNPVNAPTFLEPDPITRRIAWGYIP